MKNIPINIINYIKLNNETKTLRESLVLASIDSIEEQLLENIIINWYSDSPITGSEALESLKEISNSTLQRRLKNLIKAGMITKVSDELDNRIKYFYPTEQCIEYFNLLSNVSINAINYSRV